MTRRLLPLTVVLAVVGAVLVLSEPWSRDGEDDAGATTLTNLSSVEELRARFNQDAGVPRLILFLSPT